MNNVILAYWNKDFKKSTGKEIKIVKKAFWVGEKIVDKYKDQDTDSGKYYRKQDYSWLVFP